MKKQIIFMVQANNTDPHITGQNTPSLTILKPYIDFTALKEKSIDLTAEKKRSQPSKPKTIQELSLKIQRLQEQLRRKQYAFEILAHKKSTLHSKRIQEKENDSIQIESNATQIKTEQKKILNQIHNLQKKLSQVTNEMQILKHKEQKIKTIPLEKQSKPLKELLEFKLGRKLNENEKALVKKANENFSNMLYIAPYNNQELESVHQLLLIISDELVQKKIDQAKKINPNAIQKEIINELKKIKIQTLALICAHILNSENIEIKNLSQKEKEIFERYDKTTKRRKLKR